MKSNLYLYAYLFIAAVLLDSYITITVLYINNNNNLLEANPLFFTPIMFLFKIVISLMIGIWLVKKNELELLKFFSFFYLLVCLWNLLMIGK